MNLMADILKLLIYFWIKLKRGDKDFLENQISDYSFFQEIEQEFNTKN